MYIKSVHLENWRSYRNASFEFSRPSENSKRNVILVKGANEYGKTSFFEAVILGLFGREAFSDGLVLLARARPNKDRNVTSRGPQLTYNKFLSNVLSFPAAEGESNPSYCKVQLGWEDEDGKPIDITRTWYFEDRTHLSDDDKLTILEGEKHVLPHENVIDKDDWYRDWIRQKFIYPSLAQYFLFDGEQIQIMAERENHYLVQQGIEGLLDIPILRNLRTSLTEYAENKDSAITTASDSVIKDIEAELFIIEMEIKIVREELKDAEAAIAELDERINEILQLLGDNDATVDQIKELTEEYDRLKREANTLLDAKLELITNDLSLAIAGYDLRSKTIERLKAEEIRDGWEKGKKQGSNNFDSFIGNLTTKIQKIKPQITLDQQESVINAAKSAWQLLWHPAPEGCAESFLHSFLTDITRFQTIDRLRAIDYHSNSELQEITEKFDQAREAAERIRRKIHEIESSKPEHEELRKELEQLREERGKQVEKRDRAKRRLATLEQRQNAKKAELSREKQRKKVAEGSHEKYYADLANKYADMIDDLIKSVIPTMVNKVAKEMTSTWKNMAHFSNRINNIEIDENCKVSMKASNGQDVHIIDKSAGAKQVFIQALVVAITRVSGNNFPFIVDTPLARLSNKHRIGVLEEFTNRQGQVILLSTDEEVVDDKYDAIKDRILSVHELKLAHSDGVANTTTERLSKEKLP